LVAARLLCVPLWLRCWFSFAAFASFAVNGFWLRLGCCYDFATLSQGLDIMFLRPL
jgi:hypothetical protein